MVSKGLSLKIPQSVWYHDRLFLHNRCDAQGVSWHRMDETDMKWADNAASFNLCPAKIIPAHKSGCAVLERNALFFKHGCVCVLRINVL